VNDKICKIAEQWQQQLTPEQFEVTHSKGTERAFTGLRDCINSIALNLKEK